LHLISLALKTMYALALSLGTIPANAHYARSGARKSQFSVNEKTTDELTPRPSRNPPGAISTDMICQALEAVVDRLHQTA
jgi:hypothetical protein